MIEFAIVYLTLIGLGMVAFSLPCLAPLRKYIENLHDRD